MKTISIELTRDTVRPLGTNVLVDAEPYDEVQQIATRACIHLPMTRVRPGMYKGRVIAIGSGHRVLTWVPNPGGMVGREPPGSWRWLIEPLDVKVGDTVLFLRYEHEWTMVKQGDKVFFVVPAAELIGVLA